MKTYLRKIIYALVIVLGIAGITSPAFALTVSPAKIEITADPGHTVSGEIEIFNEQEDTRTFFSSSENFESQGDSGAPHFIGNIDGLATWIKTTPEIKINSGERILVPYTIAVPENTKPGGYFAAIFFGSQPPQSTGGSEVSIGGKIGVLVLLRVSGAVEESAGLVDFGVKDGEHFFTILPVTLEYNFNNTGGDRTVPKGEIKIKNTFQLNSATLLANERQGSVLPNSTRKFEVLWGEKLSENTSLNTSLGFFQIAMEQLKDFHFGWYTAKLNLSWGTTNQTANANYNFFVIPWQLLVIILVIFIIIILFVKILLKRYKNSIITKATEQIKMNQQNKTIQ